MLNQRQDGRASQVEDRRLSVAHFLVALVVVLLVLPLVDQLEKGKLIEAALLTLVLLSAVLTVGGRGRALLVAVLLVSPALIGTWVNHFQPELLASELAPLAAIVFVAFVIRCLLGFMLRASWVNIEVLCAALATYLLLALLWAFAYTLVARLVPHSFDFTVKTDPHRELARFEALYFSFVTLTTVGYGDIIPVSNAARTLAMAESTVGAFYLTVVIARLVSLYSRNEPAQSAPAPDPPPAAAWARLEEFGTE